MNACKKHLLLIEIRSSLDCNMILVETLRSCNGTDGEYSNMTKSIARHNSRIVTLNNNVTRKLEQFKGHVFIERIEDVILRHLQIILPIE